MGKTLWWMRAVPALRVTIGVSIAAAGIVLMPFASEAGAAGSLTLSTARAAPGEWIGVRGTGLSGCDLDRVDVRLSSINGGSSGEYADLLAAEVPVDAGDGHSIALRLPMPRPVYSSDGNADPSVSDVNHIVVTCALGGETMASTPIEIDTDPEPGQPAPPADLASRHLVVEPASGLPGTAATLWTDIHCGSTNADDGARIMWAGRELAKLSVQQSGASAYRFSVPSGPLRGPQEVSVECEAQGPGVVDTGVTRTARFEIPAPNWSCIPNTPLRAPRCACPAVVSPDVAGRRTAAPANCRYGRGRPYWASSGSTPTAASTARFGSRANSLPAPTP